MISKKIKTLCCEDVSLIENYDLAVSSPEKWICHHRKENDGTTAEELRKLGIYYNRPAAELIFLPKSKHQALHNTIRCTGQPSWNKGKKGVQEAWNKGLTKETDPRVAELSKKVSNTLIGHTPWNAGISGMHWYNNGIKAIQAYECPEGYVRGRLPYKRKK